MPLANIAVKPSEGTQQAFDFSHYQDHVEIAQAINKKMNQKLTIYPIWPAADKGDTWARQHQAFHNDMNAALKTNGSDLMGDMDDQWHARNYREHAAARQQLGI